MSLSRWIKDGAVTSRSAGVIKNGTVACHTADWIKDGAVTCHLAGGKKMAVLQYGGEIYKTTLIDTILNNYRYRYILFS